MNSYLIILFFSVTALFTLLLGWLRWLLDNSRKRVNERLTRFGAHSKNQPARNNAIIVDDELSEIPLFNRWLESLNIATVLRRLLQQADVSLRVGQLTLLMLIMGGLGFIVSMNTDLILSLIISFGSASIPILYVNTKRRKRIKKFEEQFPDALDIMRNAIRAGFALNKAMQLVAAEAPATVGLEFRKTCEEMKLGQPLKNALMNMNARVVSVDLKLFTAAVLIQKESGGNLTEIISNIGKTIRSRFKLAGQIKVFTAQGRLSSWVLGGLPVGVAVIVSLLNPDYIGILVREPMGRMMITLAIGLELLGFFVISRIVRIKFQ